MTGIGCTKRIHQENVGLPAVHGDVADCPDRNSPEWAAPKEFALLTLVAEEVTSKTKKLYMQKQRILLYLNLKEVFWYELPRTPISLTVDR